MASLAGGAGRGQAEDEDVAQGATFRDASRDQTKYRIQRQVVCGGRLAGGR